MTRFFAAIFLLCLPGIVVRLPAQSVSAARLKTVPATYQGPHALRDLVTELTAKFGWEISYEEPAWLAAPGAKSMFNPARRLPGLYSTALEMPDAKLDLTAVLARKYNRAIDLLAAALDAYGKQGNPGAFRAERNGSVLEILPDASSPVVQAAGPLLLDTTISVPVAQRIPRDHLKALCAAIEQARGIHCEPDTGAFAWTFNDGYLAGPVQQTEWGASGIKARDALIQFLSKSMTTTTWRMCCGPLAHGDRMCTLSLLPLLVETEMPWGRVRMPIYGDRGSRLPFRPPPPPPPPPSTR